jgi:hypothetical protein
LCATPDYLTILAGYFDFQLRPRQSGQNSKMEGYVRIGDQTPKTGSGPDFPEIVRWPNLGLDRYQMVNASTETGLQ